MRFNLELTNTFNVNNFNTIALFRGQNQIELADKNTIVVKKVEINKVYTDPIERKIVYFAETGKPVPDVCTEDNFINTLALRDYVVHLFEIKSDKEANHLFEEEKVIFRYQIEDYSNYHLDVPLSSNSSHKGGSFWKLVSLKNSPTVENEGVFVAFLYEKQNKEIRPVLGNLVASDFVNGRLLFGVFDEVRNGYRTFYADKILRFLEEVEVDAVRNRGF